MRALLAAVVAPWIAHAAPSGVTHQGRLLDAAGDPIDGVHDRPDTIECQLGWLTDAGFQADLSWEEADLAVLVGSLGFERKSP